jgi:hypothetical protein
LQALTQRAQNLQTPGDWAIGESTDLVCQWKIRHL